MGGNDGDDTGKHSNNSVDVEKEEEEEEDEEALSLCDLPNDEENQSRKVETTKPCIDIDHSQEEFNFCSSWGNASASKESEMCVADEVFFQGQILPLRHSVSSESGLFSKLQTASSRCVSRSESLDHCYSLGFTSGSSRSSSINSSSGSSSIHKPRPKPSNQFQYSHPSPKPQVRTSNIKNRISNTSSRKSTTWSIFRVGLVTTPEIAMQDLKFRTNSKSFGSRNSTNSVSSSGTLSNSSSGRIKADKERKKKQKFFEKKVVFFSSCKCSSKAVVGPILPSRVAENHVIRRSASVNDAHAKDEEEEELMRTTKHQQAGKQAMSRHRTFEWLKQLSLEAAAAVVIDEA